MLTKKLIYSALLIALSACDSERSTLEAMLSEIPTNDSKTRFLVTQGVIDNCRKDMKAGCNLLAQHLEEIDLKSAMKVYELSCNQGYAFSCEGAIKLREDEIGINSIFSDSLYLKLLNLSCNLDMPHINPYGCEKYADYLLSQNKAEEAQAILQSIAYGTPHGFGRVGLARMAKAAGQEELSCSLLQVGCRLNNSDACQQAADCKDFIQLRLEKMGINYQQDGVENEPDAGLNKLALKLREAGEIDRAVDIYDLLCQFGPRTHHTRVRDEIETHVSEVSACNERDSLKLTGLELANRGANLEKECIERKVNSACHELSLLYLRVGKRELALSLIANLCDPHKAPEDRSNSSLCQSKAILLEQNAMKVEHKQLVTKLCEMKYPGYCYSLAWLEHAEGKTEAAFNIMEDNCRGLDFNSCDRRDIWLFKGKPAVAKEHLIKECELNSPYSCLSYALFEKHEGESEKYEAFIHKALKIFSDLCRDAGPSKQCVEEALLLCAIGDKNAGISKLDELCKENIDMSCSIKESGHCDRAEEKLIDGFKWKLIAN
jgi:hypothetical protein